MRATLRHARVQPCLAHCTLTTVMTARRADKDEQEQPEVEVEVSAAEKIEDLNSQLRDGTIGPHKVARPPFPRYQPGMSNPRPSSLASLWQFDQEFSKAWSDVQSKSPLGNDGGSRRFDRSNSQRTSGAIDAN